MLRLSMSRTTHKVSRSLDFYTVLRSPDKMKINEKGIRPLVIKVNTLDTFFMQCQNVLLNWIHLQDFLINILKPGLTVTSILNTNPNVWIQF